ncbi:MAG: metal ABC transporter permease [Patescibacteria group bacterium]
MNIDLLPIITGIFVGAAAGYIGSFMVLRRMALVGDALSHVALPGVALAFVYSFNPFIGAFVALFIGILIIWLIESKTTLPTESLVGLMFTFALAVGLLITPEEEIFHALIGDIANVTLVDTAITVVLSILVVVVMQMIYRKFVLSTVSSDLARSSGMSVSGVNFVFLLLVAIIVALGIKVVGTLLMGALVIIPAIAARNMTTSLSGYARLSSLIGFASMLAGILIAEWFALPAGPIVVLASSAVFGLSFLFRKS